MSSSLHASTLLKAAAAAAALPLLWAGLRWFERANLYFPSRQFAVLPRTYGLASEEVELRAEDGVRLGAWFVPAAGGPLAGRKLVVLFCHGNAGNISDRVTKAELLHRLGLSVLLFDYRGYGTSGGRPSEKGTYRDAEAAWRWLTAARRVPPERIVLYGESLGTAVAVETALRHPPRALILESPFTSVDDMAREVFSPLPMQWVVTFHYDTLSKMPRLGCPVLVLHSSRDEIVPYRMGRRVFEAAPEPKEFLELEGSHDDGWLEAGPAYPAALRAFLERRT